MHYLLSRLAEILPAEYHGNEKRVFPIVVAGII